MGGGVSRLGGLESFLSLLNDGRGVGVAGLPVSCHLATDALERGVVRSEA